MISKTDKICFLFHIRVIQFFNKLNPETVLDPASFIIHNIISHTLIPLESLTLCNVSENNDSHILQTSNFAQASYLFSFCICLEVESPCLFCHIDTLLRTTFVSLVEVTLLKRDPTLIEGLCY